jgi:DNA-binding LytR/AlgR family response regulator
MSALMKDGGLILISLRRKDDKEQHEFISIYEIDYVEVDGHFLIVHARNKEYVTYKSLTGFEQAIKDDALIRIHQSYLVNYRYIHSYRTNKGKRPIITLKNNKKIVINTKYQNALKNYAI